MKNFDGTFKTVECHIMDIADDIAYSTYDLEDSLKATFLSPLDLLGADEHILKEVARRVSKNMKKEGFQDHYDSLKIREIMFGLFVNVFEEMKIKGFIEHLKKVIKTKPNNVGLISTVLLSYSFNKFKQIASDGYLRTGFTSNLVSTFIDGVEVIPHKIPALTKVRLKKEIREQVEVLKNFVYVSQIESPRLKLVEVRGQEIVKTIFNFLYEEKGHDLMPVDYRNIYQQIPSKDKYRKRIICDFIAGMTDRYAIEFYGRLKSENPQTIFKPI